jgi:glycosyltransferase involved in cell wall biosynthesis
MDINLKHYDDGFYKMHMPWRSDYDLISKWIFENIPGKIFGDIGCGNGYIISNLYNKYSKKVWGVDGSEYFMDNIDRSVLSMVKRVDLTNKAKLDKADVAICLEVAEHISAEFSDILVNNIVSVNAKTIIFTAAPPGQAGVNHINLQDHKYWVNKFLANGYLLDESLSSKFCKDLSGSLLYTKWYLDNWMVFRKKESFDIANLNTEDLPMVSVIIPTYNCSAYICRAIDSVLVQGLSKLEIIVVDDASTDNTQEVLSQTYKENKAIKIFTHKENMMLGAARNTGINAAKGKYIYFLDSDDWLENGSLAHLLSVAEKSKAEIVACGARKVFEDGRIELYHAYSFACGGGVEALNYFADYHIGSIVWNKLYLRDFIEKQKLRFIVPYWFEDVMFTIQAVYYCKKYISINDVYCNYFQRDGSYTNSKPSLLNLRSDINIYLQIIRFIRDINLYKDEQGKELSYRLLRSHCSNDVFPKIINYVKSYPKGEWRNQCREVCFDMFGIDGYAIADFLIYSLDEINDFNLVRIKLSSVLSVLDTTKSQLDTTKSQLDTTKSQLDTTKSQLDTTKSQLYLRVNELNTIYYSRGWRFLMYLRKILSLVIPKESIRRKFVAFVYNLCKKGIKFFLKIIGVIFSLSLKIKNHFNDPKFYMRKINKKSNKIVYVGHSYHNKTKSTSFLIEYLKEHFDVEVILDESWIGKPFPDLSFVDESYLAVIFFQLLPPKDVIKNIKNDNLINFPMYDATAGLDLNYWNNYRNLKIVNFSKTLHNRLQGWGLESIYLQYFPKPVNFNPGHTKEVFFWQRLTHLNINTVVKLFRGTSFKIHLHKVIDPGQEFIKPSKEVEKKFKITYSDWFETKDEMLDVIKQKGIYVAPREYEGIGMSFLEAMAMGKAVIAVDNPTMNEYISSGVTGYLFDLKNPKEIDLSNIEQVQKNSYEFMRDGFKKWEKDRQKIINFIKK